MIIKPYKNLPKSPDFTFTAIDFERANDALNSVCQVGLCVVDCGRVERSAEFLVRPPEDVNYFKKRNVEIHGITAEDVRDKPTFDILWEEIHELIERRPLVAHSFRDDDKTLRASLRTYKISSRYGKHGHLCTLELALRASICGEDNKYNLEALCRRYDIGLSAHRAGSDALGAALLALEMARELSINSFRDLADFSQTPDLREPETHEFLTEPDVVKIERFVARMRSKKRLRLIDTPLIRDLEKAGKIITDNPNALLTKETAMSAKGLSKWFASQHINSGKRRRGFRRKYKKREETARQADA